MDPRRGTLESASSDQEARSRPLGRGWVVSASVLIIVLAGWTLLVVWFPELRIDLRSQGARWSLETLVLTILLLTSLLAYVRYSLNGSRSSLFLSISFMVLAASQAALTIQTALDGPGRGSRHEVFAWLAGESLAAVLLLIGLIRPRRATGGGGRRIPRFWPPAILALSGLAAAHLALWTFGDHLPAPGSIAGSLDASGAALLGGRHLLELALGGLSAFLWLAATGAAAGPAEPQERAFSLWIVPALALAAFSQFHYLLFPTEFTERISTGDLLLLTFSLVLFVAVLAEIRRMYVAERHQAWELEAAYEAEQGRTRELANLIRFRSRLFRVLTHELANPVSVLRGFSMSLAQQWDILDEDRRRQILQRVERVSVRLRDLVEEAATISLLDTPGLSLVKRRELGVELIRDAVESESVPDGRILVRVQPGAEEAIVEADHTRILQVLRNLLSNAEKYSEPDTRIEVRMASKNGEVTFSVIDSGRGMAADEMPRLFQEFSRLASADGVPGSGLGLYVSRRIVQAHGGRIWAESRPGAGSRFSFALPRVDGTSP
jgi:signal transduction histidine kinase